MQPRWKHLWALLCLVLLVQLANAESFKVTRRADDDGNNDQATSTRTFESDRAESTKKDSPTRTTGSSEKETKASKSTDSGTVTTKTEDVEGTPTSTEITSNGFLDNSTFVNVTIPDGQLPIQPEITPGWGVAGVILLGTGLAYTLIGIKNRWIHTFFSTAYIAALGVTVLIVYVMNVPVSDALQGGYVVAVVISGCALGGASMFFKELTEGLGCALGGFCVSMWLMCLVPGDLLRSVTSKAIFISCFTLVGFAFYFSRYTRDWALILMISFAGSTISVLGIDCFSRAGLKEFWAYIWNLNDKLFPLGADTYPVTKGIRVETAAIVIVFLFGIVSQIKLWRIVRKRRERRAAERAEDQRDLEQEEANVGRQVEEANARERRQWERTYGDAEAGSSTVSHASDVEDKSSQQKRRNSQAGSAKRQSSVEVIEMSDISDHGQPKPATDGLMASEEEKDGQITIRVAADDVPNFPEEAAELNEKTTSNEKARSTSGDSRQSRRVSQVSSVSQAPPPEVVPLPFTVPEEDETKSDADRSSVATFADDEDEGAVTPAKRNSFAKRLSQGSATLLRSFSQRSGRTHRGSPLENSESTEDLVVPRTRNREEDDGSIAATVDAESLSVSDESSIMSGRGRKSIEITAQLLDKEGKHSGPEDLGARNNAHEEEDRYTEKREQEEVQDGRGEGNAAAAPRQASSVNNSRISGVGDEQDGENRSKAKSSASGTSARASLTKERLPPSLSRVALSYRTNEWAKHLSNADTPEPDELHINDIPSQTPRAKEKAVPVDIGELQKTAADGVPTPAAAITRSDSHVSTIPAASRRASRQSIPASLMIPGSVSEEAQGNSPHHSPNLVSNNPGLPKASSSPALRRTSGGFEPIAEERDQKFVAAPIPEELDHLQAQPTSPLLANQDEEGHRSPVTGLVSYSSPQTLIGQREMFLRSKSQGNLLASMPDLTAGYHGTPSDAGSLHNYPMYAAAAGADVDDLPLSQRKELMRQSSQLGVSSSSLALPRVNSMQSGIDTSENVSFNSHQPKRVSTLPTPAAREAQLANFRNSVAQDLRSGTPMMHSTSRETPFASTTNLLGSREFEVQRNIDIGRSMLINKKEAEAQRQEMQRRQKEWNDMAFDERMRSGDFLEAHREAMRRMQRHAREQ